MPRVHNNQVERSKIELQVITSLVVVILQDSITMIIRCDADKTKLEIYLSNLSCTGALRYNKAGLMEQFKLTSSRLPV